MDLETEIKPKFLNHEDLRAWFLTDLENGAVVQLPQTAKHKDYIYKMYKKFEFEKGSRDRNKK